MSQDPTARRMQEEQMKSVISLAASTLMTELDKLPFGARAAALARWHAAASVEVRVGVAERFLESGEAWSRGIALELAALRRDPVALLGGLTDASVMVRSRAVRHCAQWVTDAAALTRAALDADTNTRTRLCAHLVRRRRVDVASLLAPALLERGDARAARPLLGLAPPEVVAAGLAVLGAPRFPWSTLAASQPELALEHLERLLRAAPHAAGRARVWATWQAATRGLVRRRGPAIAALFLEFPPRSGAGLTHLLPALLAFDTARTIRWVAKQGADLGWFRLGGRRQASVRALDDAQLEALAEVLAPASAALSALLDALPPSRRARPFAAALAASPQPDWPLSLLNLLPHEARHAEARRRLALPEVQRAPEQQRALWAYLPHDEALHLLIPDGRPTQRDGFERAERWMTWAQVVARERLGVDALFEETRWLRNEQDPARGGLIAGLAELPPRLITPAHADALLALGKAVVEARDTSWHTRSLLNQVAHRLLVTHGGAPKGAGFQLGLTLLALVHTRDASLSLPDLRTGLPRGTEHAIVGAVLSWLHADLVHQLDESVLALAQALGRRARGVAPLQALLGRIAREGRNTSTRAVAIGLWLDEPAERDERVRALLDHDESTVTLASVWDHLARRRQDWLDPFLTGRALKGAWGTAKAGWTPWSPVAVTRWLPRQQRALAEVYASVAGERQQRAYLRAHAVANLARLPTTTVEEMRTWAKKRNTQLSEAALGALVWLDRPDSTLELLLEHLESDRARVAMYALPAVARAIPATRLGATLAELLARPKLRVTVYKEAVRLLGEHAPPGADALLSEVWRRPELHRDVRLALVHAARARLPVPWAWEVLEMAAADADVELPRYLALTRPADVPAALHGRLLSVLLRLADHPNPLAQRALAEHLSRDADGTGPADPVTAAATMGRLWSDGPESSPVVDQAASALLCLASLPKASPALREAVATLRNRVADEPTVPAEITEPDRPLGRRLESLLETLAWRTCDERERYAPLARALAEGLADEPHLRRGRAALLLAAHPGDGELAELEALARSLTAPLDAWWLGEALRSAVVDLRRPWSEAALRPVFDAWAERHPLVALGLLLGVGQRHGWTPPLLHRLGALRARPETSAVARAARIS